MSNTSIALSVVGGVLALSLLTAVVPHQFGGPASAFASHIDFEARRAERAAAREARRAEREAERAAENEPQCTCSARLSYAKPGLSFNSSGLVFTPRVNVDIRLRGDHDGPQHTVSLQYNGATSYESDDVAVPAGVEFSGERTLLSNASCEGRWNLQGIGLPPVTLSGITRTLLSRGQELDGVVRLNAAVAGCGFEEENRQFGFSVKEFGNLRISGWRSVR